MSQDAYIYLKGESFPQIAWNEILRLFSAKQVEPSAWWIQPSVRFSVDEVHARHSQFGKYRWRIGIHYSGRDEVHKLWVSVAVPYHCLILMEGAIYQGPYHDRPMIESAEELESYAADLLINATSPQKLVKHGYMDDKEHLTLDASLHKPARAAEVANTPGYWFKSSQFEIEPGEDEDTNPRIYGRQLARWLRQRLLEKGYRVEDVSDDDWGRCLVCSRDPFLLFVGCGNVGDQDTTQPGDGPPAKEAVLWYCFATAEISLWKRLRRFETAPAIAKLYADLGEILRAESTVTLVDEP